MRYCKKALRLTCTLALGFTLAACGGQATQSTDSSSASSSVVQTEGKEKTTTVDSNEEYSKALSGQGIVAGFIGEEFYDGKIASDDDAYKAVESVLHRIGGDDTTKLELVEERPTESGTTYYVFRQQAGDVLVHGACVKLVVNKDGKAVGVVSALLPNVQLDELGSWEVTAEQAEQAVLDAAKQDGVTNIQIVKDATEQTVIPLEAGSVSMRYAWIVYTNNYSADVDAAYLAHYVNADGEYLYNIPVSEPSNAEATSGEKANYPFTGKQTTWEGEITLHDGSKKKISVPTLTDPDTGTVYLADAKRKILCADYAQFKYNDSIAPRAAQDGRFSDNELAVYDTFIRVWDLYDSIGWTGPDGDGTPTILNMDYVDQDGNVILNACYCGRDSGFQTFAFNREDPDGECTDIIGHEFTHCVTDTCMGSVLYLNDCGSINEGISDIMGNLVEMMLGDNPNGAWTFGEGAGEDKIVRSMKDPHAYYQPEYVWDAYYAPPVIEGTEMNDQGGVHDNSSLISLVSYKLDQAGMTPEDQFYFWMNVELAITPRTDYPQLAEMLPWCMAQAGYSQYVDAIKSAVKEAEYTRTKMPEEPPTGFGIVTFAYPNKERVEHGTASVSLFPSDGSKSIDTYPAGETGDVIAIVPAGDYTIWALTGSVQEATCYIANQSGWELVDDPNLGYDANQSFHVEEGKTLELPSKGLEE